jgi:ankyrin repeat protein
MYINKGAIELNTALIHAVARNKKKAVDYLIKKGANDIKNAIIISTRNDHMEMEKYLKTKL